MKARKTLVVWESVESSNRKDWDIDCEKYVSIKSHEISKLFRSTKRTRMLLIIGTDFSKFGFYSKSVTKSLYEKFLVREGIFKLVCYCEKWKWSDISCA